MFSKYKYLIVNLVFPTSVFGVEILIAPFPGDCLLVPFYPQEEYVTIAELSHSKPRRWKSMLIHQGWFTALYTQHLLDSPSLEFEICIFPREAIPSHYIPLREDSSRVLALGLTWVRQLRSGSCHHPTAATKCNDSRAKPQQTPSVEKNAHQPRVVYCAIYPTLTRFT